jgi:hypothetical protein
MWEWLQGLAGGAATFVGSLTGSAAGLVALVIGALFNAYLNRKRDDRLRREEARSVAAALRAELAGVYSSLISNAERLESEATSYVGPDMSHSMRIIPAVVGKITLLDANIIREVVDAYVVLEQHLQNCMLMGATVNESIPGRRMLVVPSEAANKIAKIDRSTAKFIQSAITSLEKFENEM